MSAKHRRLIKTKAIQARRKLWWEYFETETGGMMILRGIPYRIYTIPDPVPFGSVDHSHIKVVLQERFMSEIRSEP